MIKLPDPQTLDDWYTDFNQGKAGSKVWYIDIFTPEGERLAGPFWNLKAVWKRIYELDPKMAHYEYLWQLAKGDSTHRFGWSVAECGEDSKYLALKK